MREIKFRGKRVDNGEWVEGFYSFTNWYHPQTLEIVDTTYSILPIGAQDSFKVDPETVGQFTGIHDKNGRGIFEGDILRVKINGQLIVCGEPTTGFVFENMRVEFIADQLLGKFVAIDRDGAQWGGLSKTEVEVNSNIYDSPELLEVTS